MRKVGSSHMLVVAFAALALLTTFSPSSVSAHEQGNMGSFGEAPVLFAPFESTPVVTVDGVVTAGEYSSHGEWADSDTGFTLDIVHNDTSIFIALTNPGNGWMAIGFSSDLDSGMGLIVFGDEGGMYMPEERMAMNFSEGFGFMVPDPPMGGSIEKWDAKLNGGQMIAEVQIPMDSSLANLEPGVLFPSIVVFNDTSAAFPLSSQGGEVHLLRTYFLRAGDDIAQLEKLFSREMSTAPSLIGVGLLGVGTAAITLLFVRGRREE